MLRLNWKKHLTSAVAACMAVSMVSIPAAALEYNFSSDAPGQTFYQSTSTDQNYIADNGQIVVGTDGTVSSGTTGNVSSSPLSVLDLPVGEYPDAWGSATDVSIAQNTVYPNELGPTTQTTNIYSPTFVPTVSSGALPTGYSYLPAAINSAYGGGWYVDAQGNVVTGALGVATSITPMPTITSGGAIARLQIPSIGLDKYVYEGSYGARYARLGFVDGMHTSDTLVIASSGDSIEVGTPAPQLVKFAFRVVDHETESFVIETGYKYPYAGNKISEYRGYLAYINGNLVVVDEIEDAEVFRLNADETRTPTANESINAAEAVQVVATDGAVIVKGAEGKNVVVSTILGKVVANEVLNSDNETIAAPAGIVVVSVDGESFKDRS